MTECFLEEDEEVVVGGSPLGVAERVHSSDLIFCQKNMWYEGRLGGG